MRIVYLDNSATTRVDDDIAAVALNVMTNQYGNPSSLHAKGLEAQGLLDVSRKKLANSLGCDEGEVFFTSGGTEANNLAIFGAAKKRARNIISTAWEHPSVLEPLRELEKSGFELRLASPALDGKLDIERLAALVDEDTALVSCMMVNSEVGHIADIEGLVKLVRRRNPRALIHCDAVQGFGKIPFNVKRLGVDALTVSGHKLHAPKGIGALYLAKSARILPRVFGGGQEKNLRPGTEPLPLIAAFGAAAEKSAVDLSENLGNISRLREYFVNKCADIPGLCINSPSDSAPYICNISLPGYRSQIMLNYLAAKGVYVSSGSACGKAKPSHMLKAMGLPADRIDSALRISFCKTSTIDDIEAFFAVLAAGLKEIKT